MKANIYEGIKLVIKRGEDIEDEFVNTLCESVEEFKETNDKTLYGDEVIEKVDYVVLYRVSTAKADNLGELYNIRKKWNRRKHYRHLMTLDEIEKHLKENYLVAVEGLGEIESIDDVE